MRADLSPERDEESEREGEGVQLPPPGYAAIPFSYGGTPAGAGEDAEAGQRPSSSEGGKERGGGYHSVGFFYSASGAEAAATLAPVSAGAQQQLPVPGPDEPAFVPRFVVPEHLRQRLPATERHFKVGTYDRAEGVVYCTVAVARLEGGERSSGSCAVGVCFACAWRWPCYARRLPGSDLCASYLKPEASRLISQHLKCLCR